MRKNKVVIGFLGTQLDSGKGAGRWEKWRPTVSLALHEDVVIERLELLYTPPHRELAHQVRADMATASPETTVNLVPLPIADPWDFGEVYASCTTGRRPTALTPSARSTGRTSPRARTSRRSACFCWWSRAAFRVCWCRPLRPSASALATRAATR